MHHPNQDLHNFIEARLRRQKEDSEKDTKWLREQEENIKKRLSISSLENSTPSMDTNGTQSLVTKPPQPSTERAPLSPKMSQPSSSSSTLTSPQESVKMMEPKPIDRATDPIYKCTTNVVRAVMALSSGLEKSNQDDYLELVKTVGLELRNLLATVDQISACFPPHTHK
jgi:focal adhesion kinase 1